MEPDYVLVAALRGGDLRAFDALYARYEAPLLGFIRACLYASAYAAEAEDVFHEAFMAVLRNEKAELAQFRAWLYTTARNLCLNRLRSQRRGAAAKRELQLVREDAIDPETQLVERATRAALAGAVAKLPKETLELFHMRAAGMSYEEIAGVLAIPLGTVKSRMHELIHHLRKDVTTWAAQQ
jgi:RNA polymerase sigma factor (sigma-70 family)